MPWSSNSELPSGVRSALPSAAQTVFRTVANQALSGGSSEESAIRMAWGAVKRTWEKNPAGEWVRKIGARNSSHDYSLIQSMHDSAVLLGARCTKGSDDLACKQALHTLYMRRNLKNADAFIAWAKSQGFKTTLPPEELHVTIAMSKQPTEWPRAITSDLVAEGGLRTVEPLGDGGAVVLKFVSKEINERWDELRASGAGWDFDAFTPHITISWQGGDVDLSKVAPFQAPLHFGPEILTPINENWKETVVEKDIAGKVTKVDSDLGIVFGWAIICKIEGEDYYDMQGDNIPEDSMLKASSDFMQISRVAGNMHRTVGGDLYDETDDAFLSGKLVQNIGTILFCFPLTSELKKAMEIDCPYSGLMIGMKIFDKKILEKFRNRSYTGFSIGGRRLVDEVIDD